jgi:carbon storage regulator
MIGDDIEITVVDIRGDKVRLGISAPTRIAVHRKEVYDAIKSENQRASQISGTDLASLPSPGPQRTRIRPTGLSSSAKIMPPNFSNRPPLGGEAQSA